LGSRSDPKYISRPNIQGIRANVCRNKSALADRSSTAFGLRREIAIRNVSRTNPRRGNVWSQIAVHIVSQYWIFHLKIFPFGNPNFCP
jgi:hypothetical protein